MVQFGLDISHWQDADALDLTKMRDHNISFVIIKATQGANHVDSEFHLNLDEARRGGLVVAAYHYQTKGDTAAQQVANVKRTVPAGVAVIPDVEAGSGGVGLTRDLVDRLRDAGYRVPLLYLPRWYWQHIGQPALAGLPPLWSSRYPDNISGNLREEFADVKPHYWDGYGGLPVEMLQFSSSGRVAGYGPLDLNAYRGTFAELKALLTGVVSEPREWDEMASKEEVKAALLEVLSAENQITGNGSNVPSLVSWTHKHVVDLKTALLDDEAKISAVIKDAVAGLPARDKATVKAAFVEALREVLAVRDQAE